MMEEIHGNFYWVSAEQGISLDKSLALFNEALNKTKLLSGKFKLV
jgi:hypothetical protein